MKERNQEVPLKEKLKMVIENTITASTKSTLTIMSLSSASNNLATIIQKEITLSENEYYHGRNLQFCYEHFVTILYQRTIGEDFLVAKSFSTKLVF